MKDKCKPKKQGTKLPFISYTQKEGGITLITLIVSIIILILLAAVSIKAITGEESIIKVSRRSNRRLQHTSI